MTLLRQLTTESLDHGYAAAASRRARSGVPPANAWSLRGNWLSLLSAGVAGLLLATAAIQTQAARAGTEDAHRALLDKIETRTREADQRQSANEGLSRDVAGRRRDALRSTDPGTAAAEALLRQEVEVGVSPVTGPGLVVRITDAPRSRTARTIDPRDAAAQDDNRVLDRDLQVVANALWRDGAEAVTINDQRLTSLSAIRAAGRAIMVGYRPLVPPYVVRAIGNPGRLQSAFRAGPGGRRLRLLEQEYGVRSAISVDQQLRLPGASGITLRSAAATSMGGQP